MQIAEAEESQLPLAVVEFFLVRLEVDSCVND